MVEAAAAFDIGFAAYLHFHIDVLTVDEGEHVEPCSACIEVGLDNVLVIEVFDALDMLSQHGLDEALA